MRYIMEILMKNLEVDSYLMPTQLGVCSKGGIEPVVEWVQQQVDWTTTEHHELYLFFVELDGENAYNSLKRKYMGHHICLNKQRGRIIHQQACGATSRNAGVSILNPLDLFGYFFRSIKTLFPFTLLTGYCYSCFQIGSILIMCINLLYVVVQQDPYVVSLSATLLVHFLS
jgi:hypothetical protein